MPKSKGDKENHSDLIKTAIKSTLKSIATICLSVLFIVFLILIFSQKHIFFYPWNDTSSHEQLQKNSDFEEVNIVSDGKNLN